MVNLLIAFGAIHSAEATDPYADGRTDALSYWWDPDDSAWDAYFARKQYVYVYKEVVITDSANSTYFMINGANGFPKFPDFYGGVQQLWDGRRVALFSAWDLGKSNCDYFQCKPDDAEKSNQIQLWAKGERTTSQRGGGEGTFMQSFIYDLDWKIGEKIGWLVSLEPAGTDSLLSVALKLQGKPWEFFASYIIPTRFSSGLPGGYGFIEDFGVNTPFVPRSMSIGPTILETADGVQDAFTNVYIGSSPEKNRHKVTVTGAAVLGQVGTEPQSDAKPDYRVRLAKPIQIPDYSEGKALLDRIVAGKSTKNQERLAKLEEQRRLKAEADAKAEANAKSEAEAKAKIDELLKAEAEAKAKAEADAKAKAQAEAKAK